MASAMPVLEVKHVKHGSHVSLQRRGAELLTKHAGTGAYDVACSSSYCELTWVHGLIVGGVWDPP